jgi:uncharacterized protein (DUF983 family)
VPRLLLLLGRAVRLRCPRCGATGLFESWLRPKHTCPRCGQLIERTEEGFFLGSLLVNLMIAEMLPLATIVAVVVGTWPHSPWNLILYGGAALAAISPFVFYPFSKLIWLAVDLFIQPGQD